MASPVTQTELLRRVARCRNSPQEFIAPGDFVNAGRLETQTHEGSLIQMASANAHFEVPPGFRYTQTRGLTYNDAGCTFTSDEIDVRGGTLTNSGKIRGTVNVANGTVRPGRIEGDLVLGSGAHLRSTVLNSGTASKAIVSRNVDLAGTLDVSVSSDVVFLASTAVIPVIECSGEIRGVFDGVPDGTRLTTIDGRYSFAVSYERQRVTLTGFHLQAVAAKLLNLSTRAYVAGADAALFRYEKSAASGFIISGSQPKTVAIRGIGPSLTRFGVGDAMADPTLTLYSSSGGVIAFDDDWRDTQEPDVTNSGLELGGSKDSILIAELAPGAYSVRLQEKNDTGGNALIEIYDLSPDADSRLANISALAVSDPQNRVISGLIIGRQGQATADVLIRALGPQLRRNGVFDALNDPMLELRDAHGSLLAANDDWAGTDISGLYSDFAPPFRTESLLRVTLPPGAYTAIAGGKGSRGSVLLEVYDLRP